MKKVGLKGFLIVIISFAFLPGCGGGSSGTGGESRITITRVTGTLTNDSQRPISDAEVSLEGNQTTTKTNSEGNFELAIDESTVLDTDPITKDVILQLSFEKNQLHAQVGVNVPASNQTADLTIVINENKSEVDSIIVNKVKPESDDSCITYAPVCGANGISYTNECHANNAGVSIAYVGECRQTVSNSGLDEKCTIYKPVCGEDGKTYANQCLASNAGVAGLYEGSCIKNPEDDSCIIYNPVCGVDGKTYANFCQANNAGVLVQYYGNCAVADDSCIVYNPVCGTDGITYANTCQANNAGVNVAHTGSC